MQGVNVVNWPMSRLLMSYFASMYVRIVTRMPLRDATAGFVCYSRHALETIDLDAVKMKGYGFQIEMKYSAWRLGLKLKEVSIIFVERREGTSKMSGGIFRAICEKAGVKVQVFTNRADEPGGSTLGNLQSHTLPIPMADIGLAQLAMHSAVETAAVADADHMINAVAEFYRVHLRALGDGTYTLE